MAPSPSLIEKYQRILQADPRSRIFVELARVLLEAGDAENAAEVCERGLEHHPTSFQARILWGKALLSLGRTDEAVARLHEAIAADPANPYGYELAGEALVGNGLAGHARPLLEKGIARHPGNARIRKWLEEARRLAPEPAGADEPPQSTAGEAPPPREAAVDASDPSTDPLFLPPLPPEEEDAASGGRNPSTMLAFAPPTLRGGGRAAELRPDEQPGASATSNTILAFAPPTLSGGGQVPASRSGERPAVPAASSTLTPTSGESLTPARPPPLAGSRRPGARTNEAGTSGSVLDLIPEAARAASRAAEPGTRKPGGAERPAVDEESEAAEAARTYEHELREKLLAEPPPRPSFIRRHARAAGAVGVALAIAAGVAIFFAVRTSRRADEARAAVEAARKGLARDTVGALREAARVLQGTRRAAPAEAAALEAEVAGLLASDFGDAEARKTAREIIASGRAGTGAVAARWLVAEGKEKGPATQDLLDHAVEGTPLARALAGAVLLSRRDREGARLHLEAATRSSPPLLRALALLGDLELARGDPDAALDHYTLVLRAHPTHPHAALGAAEARLRLGRDLPESLRLLQTVDADPGSTPAAGDRLRMDLLLARLLAAAGRITEAERRLREAASRQPAQAEIAAAQADVFGHAGDLDRAIRSAEGAARLAPGEASYRELMARLQLRRGHHRQLLASTESAPSRTLRLYRGIARFELGQPEQAILELEGTRRDGKMPAEAAGWMALTQLAAGRRAQAATIVAALLAAPSPHPLALVARGRLDLGTGAVEAAERRFREAVERDPDLVEARCDLGRVLLRRGRAAEARDVLEKAVARNPYSIEARLELARARLATGDAAAAARALDSVLSERPRDVPALLVLSSAHLAAGNPTDARRSAERALAIAPRSAAAALAAGKAAAAQGATRDARQLLERAAKLAGRGPEGAEARRGLASLKRR